MMAYHFVVGIFVLTFLFAVPLCTAEVVDDAVLDPEMDTTDESSGEEEDPMISRRQAGDCDTMCQTVNAHSTWMDEIFDGIQTVPMFTHFGSVVVYGERALPILKKTNGNVVVMAAAEVGNGRIIVTGHPNYVKDLPAGGTHVMGALNTNMKKWLTKGTFSMEYQLCKLSSASRMSCLSDPNIKILYYHDGDWPTDEQEQEVLDWVKAGGSLLWGRQTWHWQVTVGNKNPSLTYSSMPFYNVVEEAGILLPYEWFSDVAAIPVATTPEARSVLVNMNMRADLARIHTLADVSTYSGSINRWLYTINKNDNAYTPSVVDKFLDLGVPLGQKMEASMVWPDAYLGYVTKKPVTPAQMLMYRVYYWIGHVGKWTDKQPNVDKFPGDVENPPAREDITLEFSTDKEETFSTGMYLLAGQEMTIEVLSTDDDTYKKFHVLVGCHTDELYAKTSLSRFPHISRTYSLSESVQTVKHWSGGLVFLQSRNQGEQKHIKIKLTGLIKAPFIDLDDAATIADWPNRRNAPGPWADLKGKNMRFTITSYSVRNLDNPELALAAWDNVIKSSLDLKATPESLRKMEWATSDIQISVGWMHSGYPIGMQSDKGNLYHKNFVIRTNLEKFWGIFHEIGHNLQQSDWTFSGTGEVTNNIFSLYQKYLITEESPLSQLSKKYGNKAFKKYLLNPTYSGVWSNAWTGLLPYAQLTAHFGFGCMTEVFSTYNNATGRPVSDQDKRDEWVSRYSHAVGYNLCPLWEFYSLPLTESMCEGLTYPPFLPLDPITYKEEAKPLVSTITAKYSNLVRFVDVYPDCSEFDY